jgi:plastocyanin
MIRGLTGTAAVAGMALALSACGAYGSTGSSSGSTPSGSTASSQAINLEAQDFQFSPATLTAPADTEVKLTVKNNGAKKHNLTIKELGVSQDLDPGSTHVVTFSTKSSASLVYYCEYHRDSKGMQGALTVGNGGTGSGSSSPTPAISPHTYPAY